MNKDDVRKLLESVKNNEIDIDTALAKIAQSPLSGS